MEQEKFNVGVVGATGLVGGTMIDILAERNFPVANLRTFASSKSAGQEIAWRDQSVVVEDLERARLLGDMGGLDIVLMSAGASISREYASHFVDNGAVVIDNSSAWRMDPGVPLVVSEVNPHSILQAFSSESRKGIIANPNCTTMLAIRVLKPLDEAAVLDRMSVTTFQAASGAGAAGIKELMDLDATPNIFPAILRHNVIPVRGGWDGDSTVEEVKLAEESRRILGKASLEVSATCVSVDVVNGHSLSIDARFHNEIEPESARDILGDASGVELVDMPTPLEASDRDDILVGRIRQSGVFGSHGLQLFISGDNVRKGAALNAVQIAETIVHFFK